MSIITALALSAVIVVRAQGGVTTTPDQITVAGRRGIIESRTVLLQVTDPITDLQVIPLDLTREDGKHVLPAAAIRADPPACEIAADNVLTMPVTINLHDVPSGRFHGNLLMRYHGGSQTLPLTVTVKDPWGLPVFVLLLGVVVSWGVSLYRAKGRPRDKALVRVGEVRAQMRGDPDLAETFKKRIEAHFVDVEVALQAENWKEAVTAVDKAQAVWTRWRKGPDDWLAQLAYHAELVERLQDEPATPYIQVVQRKLEKASREASEMEGPHKLWERLDDIAQHINRYTRLQKSLDQLNDLRNRLSVDQAEPWRRKAQAFQQRMYDLEPDATDAYETLQQEIQDAVDELTQEVAGESGVVKAARGLEIGGLDTRLLDLLGPPPATLDITDAATDYAGRRLRRFSWATYVIAVVILAGTGFGELYVANATFGANTWNEYLALLAWGFGAEASWTVITEMVQSLGSGSPQRE
jgi:hypothetical protein